MYSCYSLGDAWAAARGLSVLDLVRGRTGRAPEDAVPDALAYGVAGRLPRAIQQQLRPPSTLTDGAKPVRVLPERMASPSLQVQREVSNLDICSSSTTRPS